MLVIRESTKAKIQLDLSKTLGGGGEGTVYQVVSQPNLVAKIYKPGKGDRDKIIHMIQNPPLDPTAGMGHVSICWPIDLLYEINGKHFGYLMPKAAASTAIHNLTTLQERIKSYPLFHYQYLIRTGLNFAWAINAIHQSGYVIGDVSHSNVLVNSQAFISIVDTDSFQVRTAAQVFRCGVKTPEYTPPELQGVDPKCVDREPYHDNFGLAVILYQLLLEGEHPFNGAYVGTGKNPPGATDKIKNGYFPYSRRSAGLLKPNQWAPPFAILNAELQKLFLRAFDDGHTYPHARPTSLEWAKALQAAERELVVCRTNKQHFYLGHLGSCPWCERKKLLQGTDPFPDKNTTQARASSGGGAANQQTKRPQATNTAARRTVTGNVSQPTVQPTQPLNNPAYSRPLANQNPRRASVPDSSKKTVLITLLIVFIALIIIAAINSKKPNFIASTSPSPGLEEELTLIENKYKAAVASSNFVNAGGESAFDFCQQLKNKGRGSCVTELAGILQEPINKLLDVFNHPSIGEQGKIQEWKSACASLEKAFALDSANSSVNSRLAYCNGRISYMRNDMASAIKAWREATALDEKWALPLAGIGMLLGDQFNDSKEAIKTLEKAIELDADFAQAYNTLGTNYFREENYSEAIRNYRKAMELVPDWPRPLFGLAQVQGKIGNCQEARDLCTKAIELSQNGKNGVNISEVVQFHDQLSCEDQNQGPERVSVLVAHRERRTSEFITGKPSVATLRVGTPLNNPTPKNDKIEMIGSGVTSPTILYKERAKYTQQARAERTEGEVVLSLVFSADERITDIKVIKDLPFGLTDAAIESAKRIRFRPAMKNGQPVSVRLSVQYTFTLQ